MTDIEIIQIPDCQGIILEQEHGGCSCVFAIIERLDGELKTERKKKPLTAEQSRILDSWESESSELHARITELEVENDLNSQHAAQVALLTTANAERDEKIKGLEDMIVKLQADYAAEQIKAQQALEEKQKIETETANNADSSKKDIEKIKLSEKVASKQAKELESALVKARETIEENKETLQDFRSKQDKFESRILEKEQLIEVLKSEQEDLKLEISAEKENTSRLLYRKNEDIENQIQTITEKENIIKELKSINETLVQERASIEFKDRNKDLVLSELTSENEKLRLLLKNVQDIAKKIVI